MKNLFLLAFLFIFVAGSAFAQNTYVGAEKCKMCHNKADKGDQYKKWKESKHAKSATSKDVAGKAECAKCHTPVANFKAEGVTCEVCHGPGSNYKAMGVMKNKAEAMKKGLIEPKEAVCKSCHDGTKAPKGHKEIKFNYAEASKKISHKKA